MFTTISTLVPPGEMPLFLCFQPKSWILGLKIQRDALALDWPSLELSVEVASDSVRCFEPAETFDVEHEEGIVITTETIAETEAYFGTKEQEVLFIEDVKDVRAIIGQDGLSFAFTAWVKLDNDSFHERHETCSVPWEEIERVVKKQGPLGEKSGNAG